MPSWPIGSTRIFPAARLCAQRRGKRFLFHDLVHVGVRIKTGAVALFAAQPRQTLPCRFAWSALRRHDKSVRECRRNFGGEFSRRRERAGGLRRDNRAGRPRRGGTRTTCAKTLTPPSDQSQKNTQIAAPQRATNQASESQTSTSSRFMVVTRSPASKSCY